MTWCWATAKGLLEHEHFVTAIVDPVTRRLSDLAEGSIHSMDMLDKEVSYSSGNRAGYKRFHHNTESGTQFTIYELFLEFSTQYFWVTTDCRK